MARPAAWLTDVEGRWEKLAGFCEHNPLVSLQGDRPQVAPGAVFVFGGDTVDRGPAGRRVLRALLAAKRAQPGQVVLLAGNRDINKLRLSRELRGAPPGRAPPELRLGPRAPLLRWIFEATMGAKQAFAHRQAELGGAPDEEVAQSYLDDVAEGGAMNDYLQLAQLAFREGETLFLHGGPTGENFGVAPGAPRTTDADEWIAALNRFYAQQLAAWLEDGPGDLSAPPRWSALIAYQAPLPGARLNQGSVVYARPTDDDGNPQLPPRPVVEGLRRAGLRRVVIGHTPCGDVPAVLRDEDGFELVMADNSYGRTEGGSQVLVEGGVLRLRGSAALDGGGRAQVDCALRAGDLASPLGFRVRGGGPLVKAGLSGGGYLLFRSAAGFTVSERAASAEEVAAAGVEPPPRQGE